MSVSRQINNGSSAEIDFLFYFALFIKIKITARHFVGIGYFLNQNDRIDTFRKSNEFGF